VLILQFWLILDSKDGNHILWEEALVRDNNSLVWPVAQLECKAFVSHYRVTKALVVLP